MSSIFDYAVTMVLSGKKPRSELFIKSLIASDLNVVEAVAHMVDMNKLMDDHTYRIRVYPGGLDVICLGLESVDSALEGHYDRVDDLPDWVKERLAVLMVLDSTPPTGELAGVGRRISESVFWVYAPTTASVASTSA